MRARWFGACAVVLLLAGCGNGVGQSATTSTTASTTSAPKVATVQIAVAETDANQLTTIRWFKEDGTETGHVALQGTSRAIAAAGSRVFFRSGNNLKALHRDGSIEDLQVLPEGVTDIIPSPDGQRWTWVKVASSPSGYESEAFVSGTGQAAKSIRSLKSAAEWLLPLRWSPNGIFLQRMAGLDGYFVFGLPVIPPVERIDPATGTPTTVQTTSACSFGDQTRDGGMACFSHNPPSVRFVPKSGQATTLSLAMPRFTYLGDVYFAPNEKWLTVAGAVGLGMGMGNPNPQPEQYGTDLIQTSDGSIVRFGPAGVRPAMNWRSWLPDGKLVLWRLSGAAGGPGGFYVLDPAGSGQGTETLTNGTALGYVTG